MQAAIAGGIRSVEDLTRLTATILAGFLAGKIPLAVADMSNKLIDKAYKATYLTLRYGQGVPLYRATD